MIQASQTENAPTASPHNEDAPGLPRGASRLLLHTRPLPPFFSPRSPAAASPPPGNAGKVVDRLVCSYERNDPPGKPEAFESKSYLESTGDFP